MSGRDYTVSAMHVPLLALSLLLMVVLVVAPWLFTDAQGKALHGFTALICITMSAGFIRGVGFIPRYWIGRWLVSGYAVLVYLTLAIMLWFSSVS